MKDQNLSYRNIRELFIRLYPIQFFTTFSGALSSFFNGLITGHFLSGAEMVALGLITPLTMVAGALSAVFCSGSSILAGRYMGRGEGDKINRVFSVSVLSILITGLSLSLICYLFPPNLALLFGATQQTLQYTIDYIRGIALGILPTMLVPCFMTFLQMCNRSKVSLSFTLLLAGFVVFFGLLNATVFHYGIFGMGLATSLSQSLVMFFCILYFALKKDIVQLNLSSFDFKESLVIMKLGAPSSLAQILYAIRNIFINSVCLEVGGFYAGNALAILGSLSGFIDAFNVALGSTVTMLASVFIGEKDSASVKKLALVAFSVGEAVALVKLAVLVLFNEPITFFFGGTVEVVENARNLLIWTGLAHVLNMIELTINSIYACEGKTGLCTFQVFLNAIIVPFIILSISHNSGIGVVWTLYFFGEVASLILYYVASCFKNKRLVRNLNELLCLNEGFETDGVYSISISTIDEITSISENLQLFCQNHGVDSRRAKLAGLCVEEMSANIVENLFELDKKKHSIDIFACIYENEISLRLRDNCAPFDPHSKLGMEGKEAIEDIGIKIVAKIAKEMNYQITFGMNILTIKL